MLHEVPVRGGTSCSIYCSAFFQYACSASLLRLFPVLQGRHVRSIFCVILILCTACWALSAGIRLGIFLDEGSSSLPGPGLWPALVGSGLMLCLLSLCCCPPKKTVPSASTATEGTLPFSVRATQLSPLLLCALWICLLPALGWLPATVITLYAAARLAGNSSRSSALAAILLPALLYLGIVRGLNWPLPDGILFRGLP